jgi:hypothetical protein
MLFAPSCRTAICGALANLIANGIVHDKLSLKSSGWYRMNCVLSTNKMGLMTLATLVVTAVAALLQPRWFRGYHRPSMRLGFAISQFIGRVALIFIFMPAGLILRLAGKDALQLKLSRGATTYWQPAKDCSLLGGLF